MHKAKIWIKCFSFILACAALVLCITGCAEDPASSKPSTATTADSQSTTDGSANDGTTTTTLPSGVGLFDPNGTTTTTSTTATNGAADSAPTTNAQITADSTTATNSQTVIPTVPKESILHNQENGLIRPQSEFMVTIPDYNPGMPGYDTVFSLEATYGENKLKADEYICRADVTGVVIKDGKVTIPEKVRNAHDGMVVTVAYKKDTRYYYQLSIPFLHWELSLEDNFDTYNKDLWSNYTAGPGNVDPNAHYVKDGMLVLEAKYGDDGTGDTDMTANSACSTRGKFNQSGGVFTSYMQLPEGFNGVPSFWLMPEGTYGKDGFFKRRTSDVVAKCSEIDIFETFWGQPPRGDGYAVEANEFYWVNGVIDYGRGFMTKKEQPNYEFGSWHEISLVWTDYATYYFLDGQYYGGNNDIAPLEGAVPAYIVYSIYGSSKNDASYYETLKVDWMRIYK